MKAIIFFLASLMFVPFVKSQNNVVLTDMQDFLKKNTKKIECDGSYNCRGLKFRIEYPTSWKLYESISSERVCYVEATKDNVIFSIIVLQFSQLNEIDSKSLLTEEFAKDIVRGAKGNYIKSNTTIIDRENALVVDFYLETERSNLRIKTRVRNYYIFYKDKIIQVTFGILKDPFQTYDELEKKFKDYEPLFSLVINSFVLTSKWEEFYEYEKTVHKNSIYAQSDVDKLIKDFSSGRLKKFECDGSGKCLGLKFRINYPEHWNATESPMYNIVKHIEDDNNYVALSIAVAESPYEISEDVLKYFFTEKFAREFVSTSKGEYIGSNKVKIGKEDALLVDFHSSDEFFGINLKIRFRTYMVFCQNKSIVLNFLVIQPPFEPPINLDKKFKNYEPLFNLIANSFVLISKR